MLLLVGGLFAQSYELPVFYGQYFSDPQVNPILLDDEQTASAIAMHRRSGQEFAGINTSLFAVQAWLGKPSQTNFHTIGLQVVSDKEGFAIRRNRIAASYARHLKISSDYHLAAGINAGMFNYAIVANEVTGGFSSYALDAAFSLKLYSKQNLLALSLNQATNASVTPVSTEVVLPRNLNLLAQHRIALTNDVTLTPSVYARYSTKRDNVYTGFTAACGLQALFLNKVMAGFHLESRNGSFAHLGIENIEFGTSQLGIIFTYYIPNSSVFGLNVNRFEAAIRYGLNGKNKD